MRMFHAVVLLFMSMWSCNGPSPTSHHFVTLTWTASVTTDVESYNVYRAPAGGSFTKLNPSFITGTAFTDTSVLPNHTYSYKVTAFDGALESTFSNTVTITVP